MKPRPVRPARICEMELIIEGKFFGILRRIHSDVVFAFALLTVIPVLVFCLLFMHICIVADLDPYEVSGLLVIAFLGLLIAFLGFVWLRGKLRHALLDLRRGLEEIAQLDPGEEEALRRGGELGRLAAVLNRLVGELRKDKRELSELNAQLDRKVRERTADVERLALVVENIGESVIMTDLDHTITYVNPAGCSMFGCEKEDMIGSRSEDVFLGIPGNPDDIYDKMRAGGRGGAWEGEMLNRSKDGRIFPVYLRTFYLCDEREKPVGHVGIARDITRAKAFREQQLKSEKLAALGRLISGIAHELNNPLTGIVGYCEILLDTVKDEDLKGDLRKIHREARRCDRIVRKLRAFGRGARLKMVELDINELVREAVELKLYQIRDRGIEVDMDLCGDVPHMRGDGAQLQQALIAILDNALQALAGSERKRLRITTSSSDGSLVIKVIDSGCGIPEDTVSSIFDPFFSTRDIGEGAGLGLSLAYGAVKEHGGEIEVESVPGEGSAFTIMLPRERPL